MFGAFFICNEDKKEVHVYHNAHGPFNVFGFEYEKFDEERRACLSQWSQPI